MHGIALSLVGREEIEPIPRIYCRTRLTRHIRPMGSCQAPFSLFRLLSDIGSAIICIVFGRGDWRRLPLVESAGNDIVRELMGIA